MKERFPFSPQETSNPHWEKYYEEAEKEDGIPFWLEEAYITGLHERIGCFPNFLSDILKAAGEIRKNPALVRYGKVLAQMVGEKEDHERLFKGFTLISAPTGENSFPYDMIGVFPYIAHIENTYDQLRKRGIDEAILRSTYRVLDGCISGSRLRTGKVCFLQMYVNWCLIYIRGELFRFGRFNFQIGKAAKYVTVRGFRNEAGEIVLMLHNTMIDESGHIHGSVGCKDPEKAYLAQVEEEDTCYRGHRVLQETGLTDPGITTLEKASWQEFVHPEDYVINIHIPADGGFSWEERHNSYEEARRFFGRHFPEYRFKVFVCRSWLLSKDLEEILKLSSNILSFQKDFVPFPIKGSGKGVFNFVFHKVVEDLSQIDYPSLPEDTSLQRGVKVRHMAGEYIHEWGGLFPF